MLDICKNIRDIIDPSCDDEKLEKFVDGYMDMGYIDLGHPFLCEYAKLSNTLMIVIDKMRAYAKREAFIEACVSKFKTDDRMRQIYQDMVMAMANAYNEGVLHGCCKEHYHDGK